MVIMETVINTNVVHQFHKMLQVYKMRLKLYSQASRQRAELEADYSSVRASVRASVRPPPRGSSKHMLLHHTV